MKIHKWVQFEKEIEVDISKEDIQRALAHIEADIDSVMEILTGLHSFAAFLKAIPEPMFAQLNPAQRRTISEFFKDQMNRFKPE